MTQMPGTGAVPTFTICDRLRKSREFAGLEQGELAEDIEVGRSTIGNYETGRVTPRRIVVRQWALRCGVSFEWLWEGVPASSPGPDGPERWASRGSNPEPTDYKSAPRPAAVVIHMPARLRPVADLDQVAA